MYPSRTWSRYHEQRRTEQNALESTVENDTDEIPASPHRQDATTDAVERLLQLHVFGTAPDGLQGPSKTRRPFPRDTSTTPTQPATEGAA